MPRIVGVDIPNNKLVEISLTSIYGIGRTRGLQIAREAGVKPGVRAKDLTEEEVGKITTIIQKSHQVEGDLKRDRAQNIKRLMDIGCYRGIRHRIGLPVRGQSTKNNARTRKGKKKTVANKKKATK